MIEKIVAIQGIGHFVDYVHTGKQGWNGSLNRVNVIYAPNGSGKTTLSTIFKSLQQNAPELIELKRSFESKTDPEVQLKTSSNIGLVKFTSGTWNIAMPEVEVFDTHYVEDNLYSGSYSNKKNKQNLFKLLLGDKGLELKKKCKALIHAKEKAERELRKHKTASPEISQKYIELRQLELEKLNAAISEYEGYSNGIFQRHVDVTNKYLTRFTSYLRLTEISFQKKLSEYETFRLFMTFEVYDHKVQFLAPDMTKKIGNAKYSLSEGDKSAIALCFFLARLEIQNNRTRIVVFDDPLSSFDYSRRNSTIFQLAKVAAESVQFFLLTHDLNFANEFTDKTAFLDPLNLKIQSDGKSSFLCKHDIKSEFLTSTQKDINVIKDYLNHGARTEADQREVIRCMRPVLEGVIKTKYFDCIPENKWFAEIIDLIRSSSSSDRLFKLQSSVELLLELNDFTKKYHHAAATGQKELIDPQELHRYVLLLMRIVDIV